MPEQERVTEDQAFEALQQLTENPESEEQPEPVAEPEPPAEEETPAETESETVQQEKPVESDDVASLKARLAEVEETKKQDEERLQAIRDRYAMNEKIRQERFLKKSTATDRARQILTGVRSEKGITTEDVERAIQELEGSMNQASPSYTPPPARTPEVSEEKAIILNDFLNEYRMTNSEAEAFGTWVQREGVSKLSPREQAVAEESLDGFLRIAHSRWQESVREDRSAQRKDTVEAVKSVQRTQKEAAKAASAAPAAPRKQPVALKGKMDTKKFTHQDISDLLKASVEQYR